jgi:hypothetical protein
MNHPCRVSKFRKLKSTHLGLAGLIRHIISAQGTVRLGSLVDVSYEFALLRMGDVGKKVFQVSKACPPSTMRVKVTDAGIQKPSLGFGVQSEICPACIAVSWIDFEKLFHQGRYLVRFTNGLDS